MTEVQKAILKRVITDAGLTEEQADDICLLLSRESKKTQETIYFLLLGYNQTAVANRLKCDKSTVSRRATKFKQSFVKHIQKNCKIVW